MIYKTITVAPELSGAITSEPGTAPRIITVEPELFRLVDAEATLAGTAIDTVAALSPSAVSADAEITTAVRHYSTDVEYYAGAYEATPKTDTSAQIFGTREKMMRRDFTVYTIPTREEYNAAGGVTFTIGGTDGS